MTKKVDSKSEHPVTENQSDNVLAPDPAISSALKVAASQLDAQFKAPFAATAQQALAANPVISSALQVASQLDAQFKAPFAAIAQQALAANPAISSALQVASQLDARFKAPFAAIAQQAVEQFKPLFEFQSQLREVLRPIEEAQRRFHQEFLRPLEQARRQLEGQYGPLKERFAEALREMERFHRSLEEGHVRDKIIIPPFVLNLDVVTIREMFADQKRSVIEVYRDVLSDEESAKEILAAWAEDHLLADRHKILTAAMNAHVRGEHELSIPVFITQIEGVLRTLLATDNHSKFKKLLQELLLKNPTPGEILGDFVEGDLIIEIICEQIFESTGRLERKSEKARYPNRHGILHGDDIRYYEEPLASTRCILVIDCLRMEKFRPKLQSLGEC